MIFYSNTERFRDWESLRNPNEYRFSKDINKVVVSECGNVVVNNLRTIALERLLTLATPRELEVYIPSYHNIELSQLKNDIALVWPLKHLWFERLAASGGVLLHHSMAFGASLVLTSYSVRKRLVAS